MSDKKHTPGPWTANLQEVWEIIHDGETLALMRRVAYTDDDLPAEANARRIVACVNLCEGTATEYLENAPNLGRLIASHADLLAACKALGTIPSCVRNKIPGPVLDQLAAAIAKAEGHRVMPRPQQDADDNL